jgi:hypothetical protein
MNSKLISIILVSMFFFQCKTKAQKENKENLSEVKKERKPAKFEPKEGVLLFVGQELEAIGGLDEYNEGYLDHFKRPAGWTTYTSINPGENSFGFRHKGLDGLWDTNDWGDNDSNASLQLKSPNYKNMALAIGLSFVNHEEKVADGTHDKYIKKLGDFLLSLGKRPVFLRIAYEFDGHPWNHYDRKSTVKAYKRMVDMLRARGITNTAFVWQSTGFMSTPEQLEDWYPGDDYVDWLGFSFFNGWKKQQMIEFARSKGKPVFIAEATPTSSDKIADPEENKGITKEMKLSNPKQAQMAWDEWFVPFFKTIDDNADVVKAISYINCHWDSHRMWFDNPTFKGIDARLHLSDTISKRWVEKISNPKYIHSSPSLYDDLNNNK